MQQGNSIMEGIRKSISGMLRRGVASRLPVARRRGTRPLAARRLVAALIIFVAQLAATAMLACPNCKEALASQEGQGLADGLNYTVLGMVSLPFLLVGTVAAVIIRAYTKRSA